MSPYLGMVRWTMTWPSSAADAEGASAGVSSSRLAMVLRVRVFVKMVEIEIWCKFSSVCHPHRQLLIGSSLCDLPRQFVPKTFNNKAYLIKTTTN